VALLNQAKAHLDSPLELTFRNMAPSAELESLIRKHVARLEQRDRHIIGCWVTVDPQNGAHRSGNLPTIHIEIQVPGESLAVNHKRGNDMAAAIRAAFEAAAAQIREYRMRQEGHVKRHRAPTDAGPP
jgi:ribosome-associated translation inhibitor RaiA